MCRLFRPLGKVLVWVERHVDLVWTDVGELLSSQPHFVEGAVVLKVVGLDFFEGLFSSLELGNLDR